jgi:hypothetical protein
MSDDLITGVVSVLIAVVGVALISVLVSKNADTSGVITSGGNAFGNILGVAISPVMGGGSRSSMTMGYNLN